MADDPGLLVLHRFRQEQCAECGRDRECGNQAAANRIGIGFRHRPENVALNATQREEWYKRGNDDGGGKENSLADLGRGARYDQHLAA
jgi:hypothetical protein